MKPPILAITLGDPAGIGPEIITRAWSELRHGGPAFVVIGDLQQLLSAPGGAGRLAQRIGAADEAAALFATALPVIDIPLRSPVVAGRPSPASAPQIIGWIETAVGLALSGDVSGIVTAPIAKAPLYEAGFAFPGHTEFLGALTAKASHEAPRGPVMMLVAGDLRAAPATVHHPISEVPGLLTIEGLVTTGVIVDQALKKDFGVAAPRLAMSGLNPHAGEGGRLGGEEERVISPAIRALRDLGIDCRGPIPADTLFHAEARATYDAAICMYHDQALIPVKMLDFWGGVNVTLGLPIVRTSPDHGVAYDIAGRGLARADSLIAAIRLAAEIAARRRARMSLADLPPLREVLAGHGLTAKKAFGQHFLLDLNITARIARLAGPLEGSLVIEVGAGPGGLTRASLAAGARVIAIEKDPRFLPILDDLATAADGMLTIVQADALDADETSLTGGAPAAIVANLPYNVGTPLLIKWLTGPFRPASMTLMFQKEVAQRIVAAPGSDAYGRLSVICGATATARLVMDLPARAFTPPPKVASAVVRLEPFAPGPSPALIAALESVTAAAFGQRRKMLRSSLKPLGGEALCRAAGIDSSRRAETLGIDEFIALAKAI